MNLDISNVVSLVGIATFAVVSCKRVELEDKIVLNAAEGGGLEKLSLAAEKLTFECNSFNSKDDPFLFSYSISENEISFISRDRLVQHNEFGLIRLFFDSAGSEGFWDILPKKYDEVIVGSLVDWYDLGSHGVMKGQKKYEKCFRVRRPE